MSTLKPTPALPTYKNMFATSVVNFTKNRDQTGPGKKYTPEKVAKANASKLKYTLVEYKMVLKSSMTSS